MKHATRLLYLFLLFTLALASCQGTDSASDTAAEPEASSADVESQIAQILTGDVTDFHVIQLDMQAIAEGLRAGEIKLPVVDAENELFEIAVLSRRVQLRLSGHEEGLLRTQDGSVESVLLPPEQNYRIGDCDLLIEEFTACGSLTVLDEAQTMIGGLLLHETYGLSFFEPVASFIDDPELRGWHIIYNIAGTEPTIFDGDDDFIGTDASGEGGRTPGFALPTRATALKSTNIVLDGDVTFYTINTNTVWSRQEEVLNAVSTIYGLIEPLSFENPNVSTWSLDLNIKGQEVWISGGPTTTNRVALTNEITDPNYFLLNPVNDDEIHFLFVGYNVSGVLGRAAGIGAPAAFGGAAGNNHAYGEARSTQSLKTRWIVMAHEVGHLIGGQHADGVAPGCTQFFIFIPICGTSIMPAGGAAAPEDRAPFFSDDNDDNIANVLNGVLP